MDDPLDALRQEVEKLFPGGFTLRDEANAIVAMAFRNGPIEDLHAGKASELLSNPELSRITDDEMKKVMLAACQAVETLLREKQKDPGAYYMKLMQYNRIYCHSWERGSAGSGGGEKPKATGGPT